jgi:hypothetical protein
MRRRLAVQIRAPNLLILATNAERIQKADGSVGGGASVLPKTSHPKA